MKILRNTIGAVAFVILVISVALVAVGRRRDVGKDTVLLTAQRIKDCYMMLNVAAAERGESVSNVLEHATGADLNEKLASLFSMYSERTSVKSTVLDQWGQALIVRWRSELEGGAYARELTVDTNAVAIWSIGRNRTDERGFGDDVVFPSAGPIGSVP